MDNNTWFLGTPENTSCILYILWTIVYGPKSSDSAFLKVILSSSGGPFRTIFILTVVEAILVEILGGMAQSQISKMALVLLKNTQTIH